MCTSEVYMGIGWECVCLPVYLVEEETRHKCLKRGGKVQGCTSANASVLRFVCEGGVKMNNAMFTFVGYNELERCLLLNIMTRRSASDHPPFLPLLWGPCVRA